MTNKEWQNMCSHINDVINDGNRLLGEENYIEIPEVYFKVIEEDDSKEAEIGGIEMHLMNNSGRMIFRLLKDQTWRVTTSGAGKHNRPPGTSKFLYGEEYKKQNVL